MFHARRIEHYISFASAQDIDRLRALVEPDGFTVDVERMPKRCVATISHIARPSPWYGWRMGRKWTRLAASLSDGHYDGWGTTG